MNNKNKALTLVEILIAMTMLSVLSIIMMRSFKIYVKEDSCLIKFDHVLGSVSETINRMLDDTDMYPVNGFNNTNSYHYLGEQKEYGGPDKFKKLFKSRYNVRVNKVDFGDNSIKSVPIYKYKDDSDNEYIKSVSFNDLDCFTENKGITYCLAETCNGKKMGDCGDDSAASGHLLEIYIRVYLNQIKKGNAKTFDNSKAIYFAVTRNGKIYVPDKLQYDADNFLFDCTDNRSSVYQKYYQCIVRNKFDEDGGIFTNDNARRMKTRLSN